MVVGSNWPRGRLPQVEAGCGGVKSDLSVKVSAQLCQSQRGNKSGRQNICGSTVLRTY